MPSKKFKTTLGLFGSLPDEMKHTIMSFSPRDKLYHNWRLVSKTDKLNAELELLSPHIQENLPYRSALLKKFASSPNHLTQLSETNQINLREKLFKILKSSNSSWQKDRIYALLAIQTLQGGYFAISEQRFNQIMDAMQNLDHENEELFSIIEGCADMVPLLNDKQFDSLMELIIQRVQDRQVICEFFLEEMVYRATEDQINTLSQPLFHGLTNFKCITLTHIAVGHKGQVFDLLWDTLLQKKPMKAIWT